MMDFNTAGEQRSGELIPENTICTVHLTVRPGNAGEGGWLKRSKNGESLAIDAEFTITEGQHAKRKFWTLFTVEGTTEGHAKAADISATKIRAILESARGVRPDDETDNAKQARRITSWGDLNDLRFIAKIGIEKGKDGFKDKNTLAEVITPDKKAWVKVDQMQKLASTAAFQPIGQAAAAVVQQAAANVKPAWATR